MPKVGQSLSGGRMLMPTEPIGLTLVEQPRMVNDQLPGSFIWKQARQLLSGD